MSDIRSSKLESIKNREEDTKMTICCPSKSVEIAFDRKDLENASVARARSFIQERLIANNVPHLDWKPPVIAAGIAERAYVRALKELGIDIKARFRCFRRPH